MPMLVGAGGCGLSPYRSILVETRHQVAVIQCPHHAPCSVMLQSPTPPSPLVQIHAEVHDFWGVLEAVAASRHHQLLADLNTHLAALARRVEGAVSERLAVPLAPADIRLRPPSLEQLHGDVQELIEKGGLAVWVRSVWVWVWVRRRRHACHGCDVR